MNGLIRWKSFGGMTNLRQAIDRLFDDSLALPGGLKADRAEAEMENGFLKLSIPKAESAKPKAIKVKSKKVEKSLKEAQKTEN